MAVGWQSEGSYFPEHTYEYPDQGLRTPVMAASALRMFVHGSFIYLMHMELGISPGCFFPDGC